MRTKNNFYIFLISILFFFTACGEEVIETDKKVVPTKISNTTTTIKKVKEYHFKFEDLEKHTSLIHVKNDFYDFTNIQQPIVMVSLFSTWCPPCRGQIPHLSNLQKTFKDDLFILSALVHDDMSNEKLKKILIAEKVHFFVSSNQQENLKFGEMIAPKLRLPKEFPLPLMILFVNGKYFTHYEGSMPEEMIESDIKQLIQKIKG